MYSYNVVQKLRFVILYELIICHTIIIQLKIHNHFLRTKSFLNNNILGKISASGLISIIKTTAHHAISQLIQ